MPKDQEKPVSRSTPSESGLAHEITASLDSGQTAQAQLQNAEKALHESRQRFDSLVRNIPDGVYIWSFRPDGSMGFDYVSPKFCELLGLDEAAVMQDYRLAFAAAHPDDQDRLAHDNKQSGIHMTPFRWEGRFVVRGETRWIRISSDPRPLPGGYSVWNGVVSDITEFKAADQAMRDMTADLDATLHAIPDLLFELDGEGRYLKVWAHNPEFLATQENALQGHTVVEVLPPAAAASVMGAIREAVEKGYSGGQVICLELPGGKMWFELSTALKRGSASSQPTVVMLSRDITGRIRAEGLMKQWSDAFNHAALGIAIGGAVSQKVIAANPAFAALLGRSVDELADFPILEIYAPAERDRIKKLIAESGSSGGSEYESLFVRKDGSVFPVQVDLAMIKDADGRQQYRVATVQDITERKRAETMLRESEEKYRLAMDASQDGLWDWDVTTGTVDYSPSWGRIIGEGVVANTYDVWERRIHPEDKPHVLASLRQHLNGETAAWSREHRLRHASGDWVWVLGRGQVVERDAEARPLRMVGTMTNIADRKRAEEALRRERDFADHLIETAQVIILVLDMKGRIVRYNSYLESLSGFPLDEMRGKDWMESFIPEHERVRLRELFSKAAAGRRTQGNVNAIRTRSGEERLVEWYDKTLQDAQGNSIGLLAVGLDITERKRLEANLESSERKLREIYESVADCIEIIGEDGRILEMNRIGYERLGYTREEMVGRKLSEFSSPEYGQRIAERMEQIKREGASTFESSRLRKDGTSMPLEVNSRLVEMDGKKVFLGISRDITERKRAEERLRESESKLRGLFEVSRLGIALTDMAGRYIEFNQAFEEICGYSREELNQLDYWELTPRKYAEQEALQLESLKTKGYYGPYEKEYVQKSGRRIPLQLNGVLMRGADGKDYIWSIVEDITERKKSEERLKLTARVFESTLEGIMITDAGNRIVEVNEAFTRITGYSRDDVLGKSPNLLKSGHHGGEFYALMWESIRSHGHWVGEIWNRKKSGEVYPEALTISAVRNELGEVVSYVGVFSDITHLKQHEKQLERTAHYDALTGIPNRVLLADRMKQALAHARRSNTLLAVCYLDLDGFKPINDGFGHDAGDRILIEVARRIENEIRGDDTVARLGGDEFVILLVGMERPEECAHSLKRLLETISRPIVTSGRSFSLSASIGVTLYPFDEEDADTLLRHSDQAMYTAKQSGKNRYYLYDPEHDQRARAQHVMLEQIAQGLEQNQFELYYQPKVDMRSRKLAGAEALIRWRHPQRGLVPPAEFLRVLEDTELDIRLGEWVITTALEQLSQWQQAGLKMELSINISAFHLQSPGFAAKLKQHMADCTGLNPGSLQIEIVETAALEDVQKVTTIIEECRSFGVGFALDDFGTGYSSLSYLSTLPVDTLKIDQSFVRDMLNDKGDHAIVQGVIALAKAFGREIVAEGIETDETFQALLDMGCEIGQGYGIARPMPAGEFFSWQANAA